LVLAKIKLGAALLVFALGAGISIYEGIEHFRRPEPNRQSLVSYAVLALSALFDGYTRIGS
jgi:NAD-dependent SIR2 family protein deacetylase